MACSRNLESVAVTALACSVAAVCLYGVAGHVDSAPAWIARYMVPSERTAERAYRELLVGRTQSAIQLFESAVAADPASAYRWCDLGEALLAAGQPQKAARCLSRATELGPNLAPILMRAASFHFRIGQPKLGLTYGARLLALVPDYDGLVFDAYTRAELPTEEVFEYGIRDGDRRAAQSCLRHLLASANLEELAAGWRWLATRSLTDDALADEYVTRLMQAHAHETALAVWRAHVAEPGYQQSNFVYNGGFERAPRGTVFDWRITPVAGCVTERDTTVASSGTACLRLRFEGIENVAYSHAEQTICVRPGVYRFTARVRADGITTDQGVGFRIFDPEASHRLDTLTERVKGTSDWVRLEQMVRVPPQTRVIKVLVLRSPSWKFDNKVAGTAWIDDVGLTRVVQ